MINLFVRGGFLCKEYLDYINVLILIVNCVSVVIVFIFEGFLIVIIVGFMIIVNFMKKN